MRCSESPRIFSKVVRAVVYRARAMGINVFSYLDNTLTFDLSYLSAKTKSYQFADLLTSVGFLLHKDKSVCTKTSRAENLPSASSSSGSSLTPRQ